MVSSNRLSCWIAGAALAALLASAASADIFPAGRIGGFYQQTTNTTSTNPPQATGCNSVTNCAFVFSRIPKDKQLIVTTVSCRLQIQVGEVLFMTLYPIAPSGVSALRVHYMQPNRTVASNFVLDATTLTLIYRRQRPLITVQASQSTNITGSCTIAGRIIDAP